MWARTQLLYVCSPDNPTGRVMTQDDWQRLFELSDRYGFVIAADECYSEVYFDEARRRWARSPPRIALGRDGYPRLVSFGSLSKRSNVPGLRSGYVAGDAALVKAFLLYRTYHGSAMSPAVAAASIAAWNDEAHVRDNRALVRGEILGAAAAVDAVLPAPRPDAAFYLWATRSGERRRVRARALRRASRDGAAGQLSRPRARRRQSRRGIHAHRAGRAVRRVRRRRRRACVRFATRRGARARAVVTAGERVRGTVN